MREPLPGIEDSSSHAIHDTRASKIMLLYWQGRARARSADQCRPHGRNGQAGPAGAKDMLGGLTFSRAGEADAVGGLVIPSELGVGAGWPSPRALRASAPLGREPRIPWGGSARAWRRLWMPHA